MKSDFIVALTQLAAERNLPREIVLSAIEAALVSAYKKDNITANQNISVKLDPGSGDVHVYVLKTVVEEVEDPQIEITLKDALKLDPSAEIEGTVVTDSFPHNAGRIAAQTAKQVVMQRLREAERELVFQEYEDKEGEVFSVSVQRVEPRQVIVDLGRAEAVLPVSEQSQFERYRSGQKMKVLLKEVARSVKGPELIVSRADKLLLKRLFQMEVPEIYNGAVEIVAIAREPGSRSKVAVRARQDGVDPVGSCVGLRGVRIQNIVNELHGEKIDVMEWSKESTIFIANALSPSQVLRVELNSELETATAVVPERQLSLAIGKEGQNARLAARLTGWKVDIKSNVEYDAEVAARPAPEPVAEAAEPVEEPEELEEAVLEPVLEDAVAVQIDETEVESEEEIDAEVLEPVSEAEPVEAELVEAEAVVSALETADTEVAVDVVEDEAVQTELDASPDEITEPDREPVAPVGDRVPIREASDDVWSVRRARAAPEPGQIRFAEDIEGLRGGVTASRRGRANRDTDTSARGAARNRRTKSGKKRR